MFAFAVAESIAMICYTFIDIANYHHRQTVICLQIVIKSCNEIKEKQFLVALLSGEN
jgi:hypothetical protein